MLAYDGSNWQHVNLFSVQRDIEPPVIDNLSSRFGGFLKSLSLQDCKHIGDSSLKYVWSGTATSTAAFTASTVTVTTSVTSTAAVATTAY